MNRRVIKEFLQTHDRMRRIVVFFYNAVPFRNKIKPGKGNQLINEGLLKNTKISIQGHGNTIIISPLARLFSSSILIHGNSNKVFIGNCCYINQASIYIEDSGGGVEIGENTSICGSTHLASIEGCKITIGKDCLFSSGINVRTGDSHSILDNITKSRINKSRDVTIGNHVWVGNQTTILKGVNILDNTVVATGSIVTKECVESNVILAGVPARIVKTDITWDGQRI